MNGPTFAPPDPAKIFGESAERFTKFWNDFASGVGGMEAMDTLTPEAMRKMRGTYLNALAATYDEYLRSPEFTGQLSQMLQQGVQFQQKMAEMLGQTRSTFQASSRQDIDSLMEVMQRLERRIGDGFARLDERVRSLEATVEGGKPRKNGGADKKKAAVKGATKRTAPRAARPAAKKMSKKAIKKSAKKKTARIKKA